MVPTKLILLLISCLFSCCYSPSKPSESKTTHHEPASTTYHEPERRFVRIAMPDTTYRHFLSEHDSLASVDVTYADKEPFSIFLNFHDLKPKQERMYFDLGLAGDRHFFEGKYSTIWYFNAEQIDRIPWAENDEAIKLLSTTFDGDSVICNGELVLPNVVQNNRDSGVGSPARYQGDISMLAAKIAERLVEKGKEEIIDSALVFEGTVTKQFQLEDLTLVLGEKSAFSDLAADVLLEKGAGTGDEPPRAGWFPTQIDRGPTEVRTRIFVKLEPDGTVTIETPRKLRTFTRG